MFMTCTRHKIIITTITCDTLLGRVDMKAYQVKVSWRSLIFLQQQHNQCYCPAPVINVQSNNELAIRSQNDFIHQLEIN